MTLSSFLVEIGFKVDDSQLKRLEDRIMQLGKNAKKSLASVDRESINALKAQIKGIKEVSMLTDKLKASSHGQTMSDIKEETSARIESVGKVEKSYKGLLKSIKIVAAGIGALIANQLMASRDAFSMQTASFKTGLSMADLERAEVEGTRYGISRKQTRNVLSAIAESTRRLTLTGEGGEAYKFLGIDPDNDPRVVLEQLRNRTKDFTGDFKQLSGYVADFAKNLGVSAEYLAAMLRNPSTMEISFLDEETYERNIKIGQDLMVVWTNIQNVLKQFAATIWPILEPGVKLFNQLALAAIAILKAIEPLSKAIGPFIGSMIIAGGLFAGIVKSIEIMIGIIPTLIKALAGLRTMLLGIAAIQAFIEGPYALAKLAAIGGIGIGAYYGLNKMFESPSSGATGAGTNNTININVEANNSSAEDIANTIRPVVQNEFQNIIDENYWRINSAHVG